MCACNYHHIVYDRKTGTIFFVSQCYIALLESLNYTSIQKEFRSIVGLVKFLVLHTCTHIVYRVLMVNTESLQVNVTTLYLYLRDQMGHTDLLRPLHVRKNITDSSQKK